MKSNHFVRYTTLAILFGVMALTIVIKLVQVQMFPQKEDLELQEYYHSGELRTLVPTRGQIYDRWGHLLAGNEVVYEVGVDIPSIQNPETIALAASSMLGKNYNEILAAIDFEDDEKLPYQYLMLADYVPAKKAQEILSFQKSIDDSPAPGVSPSGKTHSLYGLLLQPHLARTYPEKSLASNILGFVSREDRGYFGVEERYNDLLAGIKKSIWVSNDPNKAAEAPNTPEGASLVLTIDREIQATLEEILDDSIKDSGADGGTILVMNPNTGEILGMASSPRMDLNEYWRVG